MAVNPSVNRRHTELFRNGTVFTDKKTAINEIYVESMRTNLNDGELFAVRYSSWYSYGLNGFDEVSYPGSSSVADYTFADRVAIETTTTTSRAYNDGDFVLVPNASGEYNAFECTTNAPVGTTIAQGDYFSVCTSTAKFQTVNTLLGLATAYIPSGSTTPISKISFYEDEDSIQKMLEARTLTSTDKTVTVTNTISGFNLAVNIGTSLVKDANGVIDINIDGRSIVKDSNDSNKVKANIDGQTVISDSSDGYKLKANIDNKTIKSDPSDSYKMKVNIDGTTLVSDPTTGVISVSPTAANVFGENAIDVTDHTSGDPAVVDGKLVKLKINSNEKILSQDSNGLKTTLTVAKYIDKDYDTTTDLPANVRVRYRLKNGDTATSATSNIGEPIDIYKDSSLITAFMGDMSDTLQNGAMYRWKNGTSFVYTTSQTPSVNDTAYVQNATNLHVFDKFHEVSAIASNTITVDNVDYTYDDKTAEGGYILHGTLISGESIDFLYFTANGTYDLVKLDIESLIIENEFGDGLVVDNHIVKANLGTGLGFDSSNPKKITLNAASNTAVTGLGGIRVGAVNSNAVTGNADAYLNAITTDSPTASNGQRRYAVLRDVDNLAYVTVPNESIAQYSVSQAGGAGLTGVENLIVRDSNGDLTTLNDWDCGTY